MKTIKDRHLDSEPNIQGSSLTAANFFGTWVEVVGRAVDNEDGLYPEHKNIYRIPPFRGGELMMISFPLSSGRRHLSKEQYFKRNTHIEWVSD